MTRFSIRLTLVFLFVSIFLKSHGQENSVSSCDLPGIFESDSILDLIVFANYDSLLNDRYSEPVKRPARVRYLDACGNQRTINAHISVRGKFRKKPENCAFPSLRLFFSKDSVTNTVFEGLKNIKMVVQCQPDIPQYEQYVFGEYLIYKWYQQISPYSFKVRLVRCTFSNLGKTFSGFVRYAILLEPKGSFEKRNRGKFLNVDEITIGDLDQEEYKKLCFFQYMILNNDWAAAILHNIEIFRTEAGNKLVAVPFDFDFAGIIGIPYRIPSATNDTILKPSRDFKGVYSSRKDVIQTIRFFNKKRRFFYRSISNSDLLDEKTKESFKQSLDEFYMTINFPPFRKKYIFKITKGHTR